MVCIRNILKELYVPSGSSFGTNAIVPARGGSRGRVQGVCTPPGMT